MVNFYSAMVLLLGFR